MQTTIPESNALLRITYDATTLRLQVEFRDRTIYRYSGVSPEVHTALMRSESKGRFLNAAIRGRFPHARIHPATDSPW